MYWPLLCGGYQISIAYCLFFIQPKSRLVTEFFIMRTERLFLGNETSVNMFDHLFFLHSSFVSLSSPSEGSRNCVYFKRKEH